MKRSNEQTLGEIIKDVLKTYGLESRVTQTRVAIAWDKVMGPFVAGKTDNLTLQKDTLIVKISSSALKSELSYAKEMIVKNLNKECGSNVIKKIVIM